MLKTLFRPSARQSRARVLSTAASSANAKQTFFITGAQGFLGSWVINELTQSKTLALSNARVFAFDLPSAGDRISRQVLQRPYPGHFEQLHGDIADKSAVQKAIDHAQPTHVIHLAGLQVPTCRANPQLGSLVNVTGTLNVFQAVQNVKVVALLICDRFAHRAMTGRKARELCGVRI